MYTNNYTCKTVFQTRTKSCELTHSKLPFTAAGIMYMSNKYVRMYSNLTNDDTWCTCFTKVYKWHTVSAAVRKKRKREKKKSHWIRRLMLSLQRPLHVHPNMQAHSCSHHAGNKHMVHCQTRQPLNNIVTTYDVRGLTEKFSTSAWNI